MDTNVNTSSFKQTAIKAAKLTGYAVLGAVVGLAVGYGIKNGILPMLKKTPVAE